MNQNKQNIDPSLSYSNISQSDVEEGRNFLPKFSRGAPLLPCVVQSVETGQILMLAFVNEEALSLSLETGRATFFSRKRQRLWVKGETSGNYLEIREILVDCDQDSFVYRVHAPAGGACHTLEPKQAAGAGAEQSEENVSNSEQSSAQNAPPKNTYPQNRHRASCFYRRLSQNGLEFL